MSDKKYDFLQFTATRTYTNAIAYSPNGEHIAHVNNATGQFNLWLVPSGGGFARQLTAFDDKTVRSVQWMPDGESMIFQADQNGDEQHQLYQLPKRGGWPQALTDNLKAQHNITDISKDGRYMAYCANDRVPQDMDVIIRDMETGANTCITQSGLNFPGEFSPDGRYLQYVQALGNDNQYIYLYDRETGETTSCTDHDGAQINYPGPWKPDGSGFYIVTNRDREFNNIAFYHVATGEIEWVYTVDHDIETGAQSKDGKLLVWVVNEDGMSKLIGINAETNEPFDLPDIPLGVVDAITISPNGKRAALVLARATEAANLHEIDFEAGTVTALGQSMLGGIDPADMIEPELVHYETFDGRQIPAWLYKPKTVDGMRYPVILSIHGGPEAQECPRYNYNGFYQYMLNMGFGILAPNIRGSTGYGISYQQLIHRDWGGDELKDIEYAAKYLQGLDWVDSNRLAVYGGSFGGFATLSAVTRLPQYWAVGVDIVGPSNLISFVDSVPPFWKPIMKKWIGDAEEDRDFLIERSPITYVDNIRAPLLVIQGANDPRVVQAESDQMVERIRENGGDVEYYIDPEEGHGATRRENSIKWFRMIAEFLEERLLD
jgi:dipeptidyl aminopeptidase/acylaminoacyl peptidase